ncbi:hypothetical protein [Rummeliibacillus suwonensis]|uniref:hypothetical protein n=1 Tax=Rummeliibacillus suwonensis TaxID=1306154 RepID=UPI002897648E|nr:hypothetical protein [Rummeliibacillus suwonensis]
MNIFKLLSGLLGATLLMCFDFYQQWTIWKVFPNIAWMIVGFGLLLFSVYTPAIKDRMMHFYVEVAVMTYLIVLMFILPLAGGKSSVGFSVKEPFLWIVILLTIWQLMAYRKRILRQLKDHQKNEA